MLLVSSPSNFLPCGGSSYCCKSDALAKNTKNKQGNANDIYNEIVHYSFSFINYFQRTFTFFSKALPSHRNKLSRRRAENQLTTTSGTNISSVSDV